MSKTTAEAAATMLAEIGRREQWIKFRDGRVMAEYVLDIALTMSRRAENEELRAFWFATHWRWLTADPGSDGERFMERVCERLWAVTNRRGR